MYALILRFLLEISHEDTSVLDCAMLATAEKAAASLLISKMAAKKRVKCGQITELLSAGISFEFIS